MIRLVRIAEGFSALCLLYFALASSLVHPLNLIIFVLEALAAFYVAARLDRQHVAAIVGVVLAVVFLFPVIFRLATGALSIRGSNNPAFVLSFVLVGVVVVCQLISLVGTLSLVRRRLASA